MSVLEKSSDWWMVEKSWEELLDAVKVVCPLGEP